MRVESAREPGVRLTIRMFGEEANLLERFLVEATNHMVIDEPTMRLLNTIRESLFIGGERRCDTNSIPR